MQRRQRICAPEHAHHRGDGRGKVGYSSYGQRSHGHDDERSDVLKAPLGKKGWGAGGGQLDRVESGPREAQEESEGVGDEEGPFLEAVGVEGEEEALEHLGGEGQGGHFDEWGGVCGVVGGVVGVVVVVVVGVNVDGIAVAVEAFGKKYGEEYRGGGGKCQYWEGDAEDVEEFDPHRLGVNGGAVGHSVGY